MNVPFPSLLTLASIQALTVKDAYIDPETQRFRYWLTRVWDPELALLPIVMLNPSDADANIDDPTICKLLKYVWRWSAESEALGGVAFGGFKAVNLFARRSPDPKLLIAEAAEGKDIVGPENDQHLRDAVRDSPAPFALAAWGSHALIRVPKQNPRASQVRGLLQRHIELRCLVRSKEGNPDHPLYKLDALNPIPYLPRLP